MNILQAEAILWNKLTARIGTFYNGTCDIVEMTQAPDVGGLSVESTAVVASVPCRLVEVANKTVNGDTSATRERRFTLYIINSPMVLDSYQFTNFSNLTVRKPNAMYKMVIDTELSKSTQGVPMFAYTVKGLKRIDKDA